MTMEISSTVVDSINVLEISGSFDIYTVTGVRAWFDQAATQSPLFIVVDLAQVDFIDSTALAILVQGLKRARERDGDISLSGLRAPVRMVFELTRLDKVFEIYPTKEEAIAAFHKHRA
jgi:anti-sigma B factor antagonist